LDFVKFYSKRNPDISSKAGRGDYSNLMPQYFTEDLLRVYTKKPQYFGLVQAGYRAVLASVAERSDISLSPDPHASTDSVAETITPPATEAPSTPPAHSHSSSGDLGKRTPFSNNSFTTVSKDYGVPNSPSSSQPRRTRKRRQGVSDELEPPRKKRG